MIVGDRLIGNGRHLLERRAWDAKHDTHLLKIVTYNRIHCLWYLVLRTLLASNLNWMPGGLKVSRPLIINIVLFIRISNILI